MHLVLSLRGESYLSSTASRCRSNLPHRRPQVSEHLDIGRDESDEAKVEALSQVHAVGDSVFVKVSCWAPLHSTALPGAMLRR